jgi:actin-like ATPase involved in cell morphogenesis
MTDKFIEKARLVHGDKYDYSKVEYINNSTNIIIICKIHGKFKQQPNNHLMGKNCKKCSIEIIKIKLRSNTEEFIEKARLVHGDKYDYSKVEYINNSTKINIICKIHDVFEQTPAQHLSG